MHHRLMRTEQNLKTMEVTILIGDMIYNKIIDKNDYSAYPNDKSKIISMLKSDAYLASIIKDNELSINIMGTTIQVEVLKKQMDKCLVCEKEYTKVKSWQKYCSKFCKSTKIRKDWKNGRFVYGFSDIKILIDGIVCNRACSISYEPLGKLMIVIDYLDFLELEKEANLGKLELRRSVYDDRISEVDFIVHNPQIASVVHTHFVVDDVKSRIYSGKGSGVLVELTSGICSIETKVISDLEEKKALFLTKLEQVYKE